MSIIFSSKEARNIAIFSQGLHRQSSSIAEIFANVKCIQLDPLVAVRESHELVCLSRGATLLDIKSLLDRGSDSIGFIYPGHALAILPMESWPWFGYLRRRVLNHGWRGPEPSAQSIENIRSMVRERSRISTRDFKDGKGNGWDRSSSLQIAAQWLLWTGELISTSRAGRFREYSFAKAVVPANLFDRETTDPDCFRELVIMAMDALGIATLDDIVDYFRLPKSMVAQCIEELEFTQAQVQGWDCRAWVSRRGLEFASLQAKRLVPLSPFDSLIWHRPRLRRIFNKEYLLEAYKPAAQRLFGHYFIAVLAGDEIVGRVAPRRVAGELRIENKEFVTSASSHLIDEAISILASWTAGANHVMERSGYG